MNEQTNYPNWTDEQWRRVTELVGTEADKARAPPGFFPSMARSTPRWWPCPTICSATAPIPRLRR